MMHRLDIEVTWNEFLNLKYAVDQKAKEDGPYYGPSLRLRRLLNREAKRIEKERVKRLK